MNLYHSLNVQFISLQNINIYLKIINKIPLKCIKLE